MWVGVGRVVCALCVMLSAASVRAAGDAAPAAALVEVGAGGGQGEGGDAYAFDAFCDTWMQKLRDRSSFNLGHIEWKDDGDTVVGEHVDYGRDRTCVTRSEPGKEPIGKIMYREVRYRRRGTTPAAALATPGTVIERFDVTEIFRYADGRWQY